MINADEIYIRGDDMDWNAIKETLYEEDGSLRDIVADTDEMTLEKWKLLCAFLQKSYDLHVFCDGKEIDERFEYSLVKKAFLDENHFYYVSFNICRIPFHLYLSFGEQHLDGNEHLEFDFFPHEVDDLDKHNAILDFMMQLANVLQISIRMTYENCHDKYLLKVEPTTV